jgi:MFS family permease
VSSERRLIVVVGAVVFADTLLYAVLAPILPELTHTLHLSKSSAGLLIAAYPIGALVGSIPGGLLVVRIGPRVTVLTGLALLTLSSVAFGWLHPLVGLDTARFVEGIGGACSWAGGLVWIVSSTPASRRGSLIGQATAAAIVGSLCGPVLGTVASAISRPAAFTAFALLVGLLIARTLTLPTPAPQNASTRGLGKALADPAVRIAAWLVVLPAMASGVINVLGPLRLHRLGAGAVAIGACFLAASGASVIISPLAGSVSDRRGRLLPLSLGLTGATVVLPCFTLPRTAFVLALVIVLTAATLGLFWTPAMAMLADNAQKHNLHQGLAAALMTVAWSGGQILGSGAGGAVAKSVGDAVPMLTSAGLCALTLLTVHRVIRARGLSTSPPS